MRKKSIFPWLLPTIVSSVGVLVRIIPNLFYYTWGNDFGIYYYLSLHYLNLHSWISPPNSPWGTDGYQYFPITYIIVDLFSKISGISVFLSLKFVIPVLGGLTSLLIYMIAREMGISLKISFISSLLLAIDPIQVFQTSQANYLTTGHFFLLLTLLLFLKSHKNKNYYPFTLLSAILLILSHQLSSYIFLISVIGMVVSVELYSGKWKKYITQDLLFSGVFGILLFTYLILRVPTSKQFLVSAADGIKIQWIILIFLSLIVSLYFMLKYGNLCCSLEKSMETLRKRMKRRAYSIDFLLLLTSVIIIEGVLFITINLGGFSFISYESLILSLPFVTFLSMSIIELKNSMIKGYLPETTGWILAISISMLYSAVTRNKTLEIARQVEYIVEPFSILSGLYIINAYYRTKRSFFRSLPKHCVRKKKFHTILTEKYSKSYHIKSSMFVISKISMTKLSNIKIATIICILFVSLILTSYSMPSQFVPSHNEGLTYQDEAALNFLAQHGNRNLSVATDHQIGIFISSYGFKSPFDYISILWNSSNWKNSVWEILGENGTFPKIGYVVIDSQMLSYGVWGYNGINNPSQPPIKISKTAFQKFFSEPFRLIFEERSGYYGYCSYVFAVNFSFISKYFPIQHVSHEPKDRNVVIDNEPVLFRNMKDNTSNIHQFSPSFYFRKIPPYYSKPSTTLVF